MVLSVRRSFHGFIGFLVFCWSVATPCISFATEVGYPTTDVWIPLDEAYPYVEDLYTTYNGALSEGSGVTVTADNYDELVARSIIGNWVATNMAFGEDVSLDGIMDVIEADADYFQYLIHSIEVNPLNGAYRIGQSVGAHARAYISDMLESVFGLTDVMTTPEAVALDFPASRVFVKAETSDTSYYTYNNWLYVPNGRTYFPSAGSGLGIRTDMPDGIWLAFGENTNVFFIGTFITSSSQATRDVCFGVYAGGGFGYQTWNGLAPWSAWNNGGYLYRAMSYSLTGSAGNGLRTILTSLGLVPFETSNIAFRSLYDNGTPSPSVTYSDPVVIINDNETPIISPTSVYNDWSTISNNNYNTYNTNYVTYDMGDSIYNYTYYYTINNYNTDTPLWVINGDNIPIYDYDVPTLVDVDSLEFETRSVDINSNFYQDVYEGLPSKVSVLVITMGFGVLAVALLKK